MPGTAKAPWSIVATLYAFGLLGMALVGILSPLGLRITQALGAPKAAIGLTIALFSLPPAITATFGGSLIDRIGARRVLLAAPLLILTGDLLTIATHSIWLADLAMLIAGLGYVGLVVAVPATMMAGLDGAIRTRALALWSTHAPTGFAIGLLLSTPFSAGLAHWRVAFGMHAALTLVLLVAAATLLPRVQAAPQPVGETARDHFARLSSAVRDPRALRLALAMAMPNMISYGTSLIAVGYLARVHGVSLAASAATVAAAKIAAIVFGGTLSGNLLARNMPPKRLFVMVAAIGIVAQVMLYLPTNPLPVAIGGLMLWLFAFGGQSGVCMAIMPTLTRRDLKGGTLAGLVNQAISIGSFLTPALYFALPDWTSFVAVAIVGSVIALLALPLPRRSVIETAPAAV